jgi:hypothetical protein
MIRDQLQCRFGHQVLEHPADDLMTESRFDIAYVDDALGWTAGRRHWKAPDGPVKSELARRYAVTTAHWSKQAMAATGFFVEAQTNADFRTTGSPILQRSDVRATSTRDIPVRTAAQRIGDAPAVLLRNYAKRKRSQEADKKLAETINSSAAGFLGT